MRLFGPARAWTLRWVLQLLIVETARHTGATAFPSLAAAVNWPADGPEPLWPAGAGREVGRWRPDGGLSPCPPGATAARLSSAFVTPMQREILG